MTCKNNQWLVRWSLTVSDNHEMNLWNRKVTPKQLFIREKHKLLPLKPRIAVWREEVRVVDSCGLIRVDNVAYRVPDALIGKKVQVLISEETIKVFSPGETTYMVSFLFARVGQIFRGASPQALHLERLFFQSARPKAAHHY